MKRDLPFFSPLSIAFTLAIFAVVGFSLWRSGGQAFNPGPVTAGSQPGVTLQGFASHAEFEQECARCHQPLTTTQAELCTRCHESIAADQLTQRGLHGRLEANARCYSCHPEHKGRDFNPSEAALASLDHAQTEFLLDGKHLEVECEACHASEQYRVGYRGCDQCHAEPQVHAGLFPADCAQCHSSTAWLPALLDGLPFDHAQTSFSLEHHLLDGAGQPLKCAGCHTRAASPADLGKCTACHTRLDAAFMAQHQADFGPACLDCHDGTGSLTRINHAEFFPLEGSHADLACTACHAGYQFKGTPAACSGCHAEPEIHLGLFGLECQECHTSTAWTPAYLHSHTFPLDHGEGGEVACQTCHPSSYVEYTCYGCHEHRPEKIAAEHREEGITAAELADCTSCHPTGEEDEDEDDD